MKHVYQVFFYIDGFLPTAEERMKKKSNCVKLLFYIFLEMFITCFTLLKSKLLANQQYLIIILYPIWFKFAKLRESQWNEHFKW